MTLAYNRIAYEIDDILFPSDDVECLSMLQHFDYPETWSYTGNATFTSEGAKFGKGCVYFPDTNSKAIVTNTTGMFNLSPLGNYEIEAFVKLSDLEAELEAQGYRFYDGHTFKYFDTALTWSEAKAACEAIGGHLATSDNEEKDEFLSSLTQSTTWLGVTEDTTTETRSYICEWDNDFVYDILNLGDILKLGVTPKLNITLSSDTWNINTASTTLLTADTWQHLLLRITDGYVYVFIDSAEALKAYISSSTTITPEQVELGGYVGYMDEFTFKRNAGTGAPTVPLAPYEINTLIKLPTKDAPVTRAAWSAEGLPEGMTLSESGQLTGHPTTAGSYDTTITVTTNWGTASKKVRIIVQ